MIASLIILAAQARCVTSQFISPPPLDYNISHIAARYVVGDTVRLSWSTNWTYFILNIFPSDSKNGQDIPLSSMAPLIEVIFTI